MVLKKGDRVRHPTQTAWGIGEVLADAAGDKVRIFFVGPGGGTKTMSLRHVTLESVPKAEAAHPLLDHLRPPAESGRLRYQSLPESIARFLDCFPHGFYGDRFVAEERQYKVRARQVAQDLLNPSDLARLVTVDDGGEVCRRALRVANATNLIFPNEKMALKDGLKAPTHQQAFARALCALLYGEDTLQSRFERYIDILEGMAAAKWTIATYFLFLVHPDRYMFLKPTVTQHAADISGFDIHYRSDLNWRTYEAVLAFAQYLTQALVQQHCQALMPRDMIDVQSFLWCIAPGKL